MMHVTLRSWMRWTRRFQRLLEKTSKPLHGVPPLLAPNKTDIRIRKDLRVLVPGVGLARLAYEVIQRGQRWFDHVIFMTRMCSLDRI